LRPQDRKDIAISLENFRGGGGIEHTLLINLSGTARRIVINSRQSRQKSSDPQSKSKSRFLRETAIAGGQVVRTRIFRPRGWFLRKRRLPDDQRIDLGGLALDDLLEPPTRSLRRGPQ